MRRIGLRDLFTRDTMLDGARLLRSRLVKKRGLILGYHSIRSQDFDPWRLCVSPENFQDHIEVLKKHTRVIPLSSLISLGRQGLLPERSVAISFDDGYLDNLETALPMLERAGLPATVFMTTGYFGKEFWWDTLIRLVYSVKDLAAASRRFSSTSLGWCREIIPFTRLELVRRIGEVMLSKNSSDRSDLLMELTQTLDPEGNGSLPSVAMTESQTKTLASSPLIDIGCHTVSHPLLDRIPPSEQRVEVSDSKKVLEKLTGLSVEGFAFPHGAIGETAKQIVRESGFQYACSGETDIVWQRSDPFALPRLWAANYGGGVLLKKLNRWL